MPVDGEPPRAGFGRTLVAVFWSFFGVRKRADLERDAGSLNPVAVVVAALLAVALFVLVLIGIVHAVVH